MFKKSLFLLLFIFLFSGVSSALEFSADTIMTFKGQGKTTGKIYYKSDKFRMDTDSPEKMITITRIDKKVVWNIMPAQKMYMELPLDLKSKPMVEEKFKGEIERKYIGKETIDGRPTKKYLIKYKYGNKTDQVYQWWATDINFPVKTAATDNSWVQEYKNVKIGTQSNDLFEVPRGYKKFQFPGGMNMKDFR